MGSTGLRSQNSAQNVAANIDILENLGKFGNPALSSIQIMGDTTSVQLTASQVTHDFDALVVLEADNPTFAVEVVDTSVDISALLSTLSSQTFPISSITLSDTGTPSLNLSDEDFANYSAALALISNASYSINLTDGQTLDMTAAQVSTDFGVLMHINGSLQIDLQDFSEPDALYHRVAGGGGSDRLKQHQR